MTNETLKLAERALTELVAQNDACLFAAQVNAPAMTNARAAIRALRTAIDAEQAKGREAVDVDSEWTPCVKLPIVVHVRQQRPGEAHVSTREGITPVKPDDLIMRGVAGEEYPIGRELFERTYTLDTTPPAQPARELDCLEESEIAHVWASMPEGFSVKFDNDLLDFSIALFAALREKNAGEPVVKEN